MYEIGSRVRVTAEFKNDAGVLTSPTTVTARLRAPNGTVSTPAATLVSAGIYQFEVIVTQSGRYRARFTGSGVIDQSQVVVFVVNRDEVG